MADHRTIPPIALFAGYRSAQVDESSKIMVVIFIAYIFSSWYYDLPGELKMSIPHW